MYNLRSNKKDTIQFPVQIQVADDDQFLTDLLNQNSSLLNTSENMSDSVHESSDSEVDYDALIQESDNETQSTSAKLGKKHSDTLDSDSIDIASQFKVQSVINSQILDQLQKIGKRLEKIENVECKKTSDKSKIKTSKGASKSKKLVSAKSDLKSDAKSELHHSNLPTFDSLKEDAVIQSKVEQRLQELSELAKTGTIQKLKSQRGGQVEVMVKNRVKWPHEYILSGLNKERVSYDQLSVTQWVAGFGRTMREESDPEIKQHMLKHPPPFKMHTVTHIAFLSIAFLNAFPTNQAQAVRSCLLNAIHFLKVSLMCKSFLCHCRIDMKLYSRLYNHSSSLNSMTVSIKLCRAIKTKLGKNWVRLHAVVVLLMVLILQLPGAIKTKLGINWVRYLRKSNSQAL